MLAIKGGNPVRAAPFPEWPVRDRSDEEAVSAVVRSGVWGLGGKLIPEFETKFARLHDATCGVAAMNGTVTLQMALTALGIGPGDEVIIPAYTFIATAAAVLHVGAIPVFVDIDPETYCMDPKAVESAITPRTAALMPVHVAGHPADLDRLVEIAQRHHLALIEDAAQAHGAQWRGRGVGSYGDLGSFSFQSTKNLSAGEGGILITNNEFLADLCRAYRNCGHWVGRTGRRPVLGWDFRMTELQAALLLSQMTRLEDQTKRRNDNALYLAAQLAKIQGIRPLKRDERVTRHGYHLFVFRYDEAVWGVSLDVFLAALNAEGIPASSGYVPTYRDPLFVTHGQSCPAAWEGLGNQLAARDYSGMYLPVAEKASQEAVWLAQNVLLGDKRDMDEIVSAIEKLWNERAELATVKRPRDGFQYAGLGD